MKHRDLRASPSKKMAEIVKGLQGNATQGATGAHGVKHMGLTGDSVWYRPDGTEHSVRDIDGELQGAQTRIDDAVEDLAETQVRLETSEQEVAQVGTRLDTVETVTIPSAVEALEQADAAASQVLGELDSRLSDIDAVGTGELATIRDALDSAQAAVKAAESLASTANTAANAASQAALEAAGIAASKGRVIIQATEPTGDDRQAANIWIKPVEDDPETEIEERATTYVYLEESDEWIPTTSDELAQAAQNALDAREAAQQAQQRAETAVANAQAAQAAAEAAQRTADQATLDAREAHNEAVAAQADVDAAIARGDNLVMDASFEEGQKWWPEVAGRYRVIDVPDARTGTKVMRMTPATVNANPSSTPIPTQTGRTFRAQAWWRYLGGDGQSRISIYYQGLDQSGTRIDSGYAKKPDGSNNLVYPVDLVVGEWYLLEGDVPLVAAGVTHLTVAPHAVGASTDEFDVDDMLALDVTEARAAQERAEEAHALAESKPGMDEVNQAIVVSSNGKNAITVSADAPTASTPGAVVGDTWWRVDAAGDIFGQWSWTGSAWVPRTIRSEVIANLDVNKLQVIGSATIDEAVIDKLFAETFAAHKITASELNIASVKGDGTLADDSVSAVTIKDGAITTPKLTVTEELSGKIASFLSVEAAEGVFTKGLTAANATLIGQTVVDDINVQGKLVGTDGVFTGTVDFENINVTGDVLAASISGEYLYGTVVEGGEFRTDDSAPGQMIFSDTGFIEPSNGVRHPGIEVVPSNPEYPYRNPGLGAGTNGMIISGGKDSVGRRALAIFTPTGAAIRAHSDSGFESVVNVTANSAYLSGQNHEGNGGRVSAGANTARLSFGTIGDPNSGWINVQNNLLSLSNYDEDGVQRSLIIDRVGVLVGTDESGTMEWHNLLDTASDSGWKPLSTPSGIVGSGSPAYRIKGGVVFFRGTLTKSSGSWSSGWTIINSQLPAEVRPGEPALRAGASSVTPGILLQMTAGGRFEFWLPSSFSGSTTIQLSPMFYPIG